jgi:hypothetical protein
VLREATPVAGGLTRRERSCWLGLLLDRKRAERVCGHLGLETGAAHAAHAAATSATASAAGPGPSMEFYRNSPEDTAPEDLETEVYVPVAPK